MTALRSLTVMLTRWCNLSCAHCGYASGPHLPRGTIDLALAEEAIDAAAARGAVLIAFTGGEPFGFMKELSALVEHARSRGLASEVVTNAYWARTPEAATAMVAPLAALGLRQLVVSYDEFHNPYFRRPVARNAVHAALAAGVRAQVRVTGTTLSRARRAAIARELALPVDAWQGPQLRARIVGRAVIGAGNARELARPARASAAAGARTKGGCRDAIAHPAIGADGMLYPCCSFAAVAGAHGFRCNPRGRVGEALDRMDDNLLLRLLRRIGPAHILELAGVRHSARSCARPCEACLRIAADPDDARAVASWLGTLARAHAVAALP